SYVYSVGFSTRYRCEQVIRNDPRWIAAIAPHQHQYHERMATHDDVRVRPMRRLAALLTIGLLVVGECTLPDKHDQPAQAAGGMKISGPEAAVPDPVLVAAGDIAR